MMGIIEIAIVPKLIPGASFEGPRRADDVAIARSREGAYLRWFEPTRLSAGWFAGGRGTGNGGVGSAGGSRCGRQEQRRQRHHDLQSRGAESARHLGHEAR